MDHGECRTKNRKNKLEKGSLSEKIRETIRRDLIKWASTCRVSLHQRYSIPRKTGIKIRLPLSSLRQLPAYRPCRYPVVPRLPLCFSRVVWLSQNPFPPIRFPLAREFVDGYAEQISVFMVQIPSSIVCPQPIRSSVCPPKK